MNKFVCMLLGMTLLLTGCSSGVSQKEYNALAEENRQLKEQINQLTGKESEEKLVLDYGLSEDRKSENCEAFEISPFDKPFRFDTKNGSFELSPKNVHTVDWNYNEENVKVVTVQAVIENIDFTCVLGDYLNDYMLVDYGLALMDDEGFDLNYYKISGPSDGQYEVFASIPEGSKKRVALPFLVPDDCNTVYLKVNGEISQAIEID